MKRHLVYILMCAAMIGVALPGRAIDHQTLVNYAKSLKGKKKAELKTAIFELCQPETVLEYGSGEGKTWSGFVKTDRVGNTLECLNRYSYDYFYFSSTTQTTAISGMNIEHSFPKSWWGGDKNNAYQDLFNLYPSASDANNKKSNYPMGKVSDASILNDFEKVGKGSAGSLGTITLCEPNDLWKGDFCRSYFYMATIYQNLTWQGTGLQQLENDTWPTLREWAYTLYLDWTRIDTVSSIEVNRNNAIYSIQGNRNLFIDFPYLAEYVWGDSTNVAFDPYTSVTTASDDGRYMDGSVTPSDPDTPTDPDTPSDPDTPGEDDEDQDVPDGDYFWAETFSGCSGTGGNDDSWKGSIASGSFTSSCTDNDGWGTSAVFAANECIRVGSGSKAGSATTPSIKLPTGSTAILYFRAGSWDGDNSTITLSATNCTLSQTSFTLESSFDTQYQVTITDIKGPVTITFGCAAKNRFFLDSILIPKETIIDPSEDYIAWYSE